MSIKITNENYPTYKQVFEILQRHLFKELRQMLPDDRDPMVFLTNLENRNKSMARRSLQVGLNDLLPSITEYPEETFRAVNKELKEYSLPTLPALLAIVKDTIQKVLKRKRIRNLDEYYIVKELLEDTASELSEEDRTSLSLYLLQFDQAKSK